MNEEQPLLPQEEKPKVRDDLALSIPMTVLILNIGDVGTLILSILSGMSIMFCACNYSWLSGYEFLGYFSDIAPSISLFFCYISSISGMFILTYCIFSFIVSSNRVPKVLFIASTIFAIITVALSLSMVKVNEVFCAMNRRRPEWWLHLDTMPIPASWKRNVFNPYKAKDIVRCIFFCFETLLFIFGSQYLHPDLLRAFGYAL